MPKISALPPVADVTGDETVVLVKNGQTRRGSLGGLVDAAVAPHVENAVVSAAAAAAFSNYLSGTLAEAIAQTVEGDRFSISEDGVLAAYERTAIGATLIARSVTPQSLALPEAADQFGTEEGTLTWALRNRPSVRSLAASGAFGDAVLNEGGWISVEPNDDDLEALINEFRAEHTLMTSLTSDQQNDIRVPFSKYVLHVPRGVWCLSRDMPPLPPGCAMDWSGSIVIIAPNCPNITIMSTEPHRIGELPVPGGDGDGISPYGSDYLHWKFPQMIYGNGNSGTFIRLITVARSRFEDFQICDVRGSSYTISLDVVNDSEIVRLSAADYAKVKAYDVIDLGVQTDTGNVLPFLVRNMRQLAGSGDYTLKLDSKVPLATGTYNAIQMSFPRVCVGVQQSFDERTVIRECDYKTYWGTSADEQVFGSEPARYVSLYDGTDADYLLTNNRLNPSTDMRVLYPASERCKGFEYVGPQCSKITIYEPSWQFNSHYAEFLSNGISARLIAPRIETLSSTDMSAGRRARAAIVGQTGILTIDCIEWQPNQAGAPVLGQGGGAQVFCGGIRLSSSENVPQQLSGNYAPIKKSGSGGSVVFGTMYHMTGPGNFRLEPLGWCENNDGVLLSDSEGFFVFTAQQNETRQSVGGENFWAPEWNVVQSGRSAGQAHPRWRKHNNGWEYYGNGTSAPSAYRGHENGDLVNYSPSNVHRFNGEIRINDSKVMGPRMPALPPVPTDLASVIAFCEDLRNKTRATGGCGMFED
jgi:hypothetical protein